VLLLRVLAYTFTRHGEGNTKAARSGGSFFGANNGSQDMHNGQGWPMETAAVPRRSVVANVVYGVLDPIPFGCFAAALVFDLIYLRTAVVLWNKGAAWLVAFGLLAAVVPRFVNLAQVWITSRSLATRADKLDFWLNLLAIVAAVFNAFVHSRDAYAVMPTGVWLSAITVIALVFAHAVRAVQAARRGVLP